MTIIPPGFANVALRFDHSSYPRPAYTTFGVDLGSASGDPDTLADTLALNLTPSIPSQLDSNVTWSETRIWIGQDGGDPIIGINNTPRQGQASRTSVSPGVAVLVRKNTATGGRRGRGAMYLPWYVNQTAVSETGIIASASMTALNTAMSNLMSDLSSSPFSMVLLHSAGISVPPDPSPVTSLSVSQVISRQGRRQVR